MRTRVVALVLGLGSLVMPAAGASTTCPTIVDEDGDTGNIVPISDDASDLTAVDVSSNRTVLSVRLTLVGQPSPDEPATGRMYDVYLDTGEGGFKLTGVLAMGDASYRLSANTVQQDAPD